MDADGRLGWGILATGRIAGSFARDLALLDDHRIVATASRTQDRADAFVAEHGGRAYAGYERLVADPDVDVVYVASPHGRHVDDVMLCLDAGKAVLCEKALTLDAASGRALAEHARSRGLLLLEAMWMRTHPVVREVARLVGAGAIGRVDALRAELGFVAPTDVDRLWQPDLGASALLDIGIYPLTLAHLLLGHPHTVAAAGTLHPDGFDVAGGATLVHDGGAVSSIAWTQLAHTSDTASVAGDRGRIEIPRRFHHPSSFILVQDDETTTVELEVVGRGYAHEAMEVARCLREGRTDSDLLPLEGTLRIQELMDEVAAQVRNGRGERGAADLR